MMSEDQYKPHWHVDNDPPPGRRFKAALTVWLLIGLFVIAATLFGA
jgi:hypothetical protein